MSIIAALAALSVVVAVTCALPGVFLVVRRQSMLVDAMSHAVFPGIVIGAIISGTTRSPIMVILATAMGLIVVVGAEKLRDSRIVTSDASQALIFPTLFAIGIALMSTMLSGVHLSERSVLTGELNLAALPSERLIVRSIDLGPQAMWWLLVVLLIDAVFVAVFYRVLVTSAFDPAFSTTIGLPARIVNLALMTLVSLTIVVAFNTVGAILVIALMIVPAAIARLWTQSMPTMIATTIVVAAASALIGLFIAYAGDLATAPMMAFINGVLFLLALLVSYTRSKLFSRSR